MSVRIYLPRGYQAQEWIQTIAIIVALVDKWCPFEASPIHSESQR